MRKPKYDDKVIKMLRSSPLKAAYIAKTLSLRPGTMYKVLDRLIETGAVVKNGFFYSAATTENQVSPGKEAVLNTLVDKFVNKAPSSSVHTLTPYDRLISLTQHQLKEVEEELSQVRPRFLALVDVQKRLSAILHAGRAE